MVEKVVVACSVGVTEADIRAEVEAYAAAAMVRAAAAAASRAAVWMAMSNVPGRRVMMCESIM